MDTTVKLMYKHKLYLSRFCRETEPNGCGCTLRFTLRNWLAGLWRLARPKSAIRVQGPQAGDRG